MARRKCKALAARLDGTKPRRYNCGSEETLGADAGCGRTTMADAFELWRLMWLTAVSRGLEELADAVPGTGAAARRRQADAIDLSTFPVLGRVRL